MAKVKGEFRRRILRMLEGFEDRQRARAAARAKRNAANRTGYHVAKTGELPVHAPIRLARERQQQQQRTKNEARHELGN